MNKHLILTLLLSGLAACSSGMDTADMSSINCVNRSDLHDTENAPLARICGESAVVNPAKPASAVVAANPAVSPNDFVRNEAMYRAGNAAMIAMAPAR